MSEDDDIVTKWRTSLPHWPSTGDTCLLSLFWCGAMERMSARIRAPMSMDDDEQELDEDLDTELRSDVICPWCGHVMRDIWEIEGIYTDGERCRTECDSCSRPFDSYCSVSYTFSTERVTAEDIEDERRKEAERIERARKDRELRQRASGSFMPGDPVRITRRGQQGQVANREITPGCVHVQVGARVVTVGVDEVEAVP